MIRLAALLVVAVLAAVFTLQAATSPGRVEIEWFGTTVKTSALFAVIAKYGRAGLAARVGCARHSAHETGCWWSALDW